MADNIKPDKLRIMAKAVYLAVEEEVADRLAWVLRNSADQITTLTKELEQARSERCSVNPCQHRSPPAIGGESFYKAELAEVKKRLKQTGELLIQADSTMKKHRYDCYLSREIETFLSRQKGE